MDVAAAIWRKSSHSNASGGDCVEVADPDGGRYAVRDSKNPAGPVLTLTPARWSTFIAIIRADEFT